uniref:Uncharacterized protein n=1 Tax=Glossina palpalis gambiensis TaxID=67801 RepID=A0A1B0BKI3_9MUSC
MDFKLPFLTFCFRIHIHNVTHFGLRRRYSLKGESKCKSSLAKEQFCFHIPGMNVIMVSFKSCKIRKHVKETLFVRRVPGKEMRCHAHLMQALPAKIRNS